METKKENNSTVRWIMHWASEKKGAFAASVLFAVLNVLCKLIPYFLVGTIVTLIIGQNRDFSAYLMPILAIVMSYIAAEVCHLISTGTSHRVTFSILGRIKKEALDKLAKVPLGYVKDTGSGTFKNIIIERVDSIETTLAHIIPEVSAGILAPVVLIIYFFVVDWRIALFALIPVAAGMLCSLGMFKDMNESAAYAFQKTKELNDVSVEYINGIEVIKAFGKGESAYEKFRKAAKAGADCYIEWMRRCLSSQTLMMAIAPHLLLSVLPAGAAFVLKGTLSVPDFVSCIVLSIGIVGPFMTVMGYMDDIRKLGSVVSDVTGILNRPELTRPSESRSLPKDSGIVLRDVCFGYHEKEILHHVNMSMKAGSVNAIVGPSGSGKSTAAKLIASMWDVNSGSIELGGVPLTDMSLEDINDQIAFVAQDNYLFDRTIMENIRMGKPDASDEEVIEITKKSGCHEFIMSLEKGFDTVAGGAGGHLSGGERQRVTIARAMLRNAPIVILDEATAYTDPENEAILQKAISSLAKGKTLVVIAHRLSTIVDSDKIFVMKDGSVEAEGTHEQLLKGSRLYRDMWEAHVEGKDCLEGGNRE